jgi:hypothetical protein
MHFEFGMKPLFHLLIKFQYWDLIEHTGTNKELLCKDPSSQRIYFEFWCSNYACKSRRSNSKAKKKTALWYTSHHPP